MAQYATFAELQQLALTPANAARFGQATCEAILQAASDLADSYFASQFVLPLLTWDMSLRLNVCNVAAYLLLCQFGFNPAAPADKLVEERYNRALAWFCDVRDQKIFPQWEDSGVAPGADNAGPFILSNPPVGFDGAPDACGASPAFTWVPPCD